VTPAAPRPDAASLCQASVDWGWEMRSVTLAALFCGAAMLIAARREDDEPRPLGPAHRAVLVGAAVAVGAVSFVGLGGNVALARSASAAGRSDWAASAREARRAHRWAPWSAEP